MTLSQVSQLDISNPFCISATSPSSVAPQGLCDTALPFLAYFFSCLFLHICHYFHVLTLLVNSLCTDTGAVGARSRSRCLFWEQCVLSWSMASSVGCSPSLRLPACSGDFWPEKGSHYPVAVNSKQRLLALPEPPVSFALFQTGAERDLHRWLLVCTFSFKLVHKHISGLLTTIIGAHKHLIALIS